MHMQDARLMDNIALQHLTLDTLDPDIICPLPPPCLFEFHLRFSILNIDVSAFCDMLQLLIVG